MAKAKAIGELQKDLEKLDKKVNKIDLEKFREIGELKKLIRGIDARLKKLEKKPRKK